MFDTPFNLLLNHTGHMTPYLILAVITATYLGFKIVRSLHDAYFGPLSKFPGPKLRALSKWPSNITVIRGSEGVELPALHEQYGPVVRIGPKELSYAGGAASWRGIYGFRKSGDAHPAKLEKDYAKPLNRVDGIFTADDANHGRQRKILSHSFADKTLKDFEPMLKLWVGKLTDRIADKSGEEVDLLQYYNCTTFDIMGDLTFGEDLHMLETGEYNDWVKAIFQGIKSGTIIRGVKHLSAISEWVVNRFVVYNPKVRTATAEHWKFSKDRVDRRLARTDERRDLWTKILAKSNTPEALTYDEHHSNAAIFMVAGTETTAAALAGTTYWLLRNPDCLNKLTSEIRDAFANAAEITLDSVQRLQYLQAVLQEGLRMYPPVPSKLPREVPAGGTMIDGELIPEHTSVGVHQLSTYRLESNFKDAYKFHPERWLGDERYANDHLDALEAFSVGPRSCIGKNLAWHEMRLILTNILFHFDLQLSKESIDWHDQKIYTIWEKRPLLVRAVPRSS
ncbi:unnamed protein product [Zymoseptoria tritici ST99CH_3D7]|uniref:Cytochrome P450 monooxygenase n=1 Tax=Zymoseptoria tritici (strain ST99CH_3D7) TaxID=1276538 RepID=A0A1X7RMD5_ZYMT9|nr:unnamed protein product [Zymoseptoria tritici ST99CH_3D7]